MMLRAGQARGASSTARVRAATELKLVPPFRFATVCCATRVPGSGLGKGAEASAGAAGAGVVPGEPLEATHECDETVYRGAYPSVRNLLFLKTLRLRTVVSLVKGGVAGVTVDLREFCAREHICHVVVDLDGNKLPSLRALARLLSLLVDKRRLPAYLHCAEGGVSTGVLVMCLRVVQQWSIESALAEYSRYVKEPGSSERAILSSFSPEFVELPEPRALAPSWLITA
jgi:tyrosine-protein phosphatase OCA6